MTCIRVPKITTVSYVQGAPKISYPLNIYFQFSQQSLRISERNFTNIFTNRICTQRYHHPFY